MHELKNDSKEDVQVAVINNSSMLIFCPACGAQISRYAPNCIKCGHPIIPISSPTIEPTVAPQQQIVIEQPVNETNGIGTAGFILSLISLILSWVPGVGWVVWFLGCFLSFMGMFWKPRGLAVVGFLISIIGLIVLLAVVGALATVMATILE